jgi:hypothetical protein
VRASNSSPSPEHEERVGFLRGLAELIGCDRCLNGKRFLGEERPDVLAVDRSSKILFLGDAKATETPGNIATLARLTSYLRALSFTSDFDSVVVALCFGRSSEASAWNQNLKMVARESGITFRRSGHTQFQKGYVLVWGEISS